MNGQPYNSNNDGIIKQYLNLKMTEKYVIFAFVSLLKYSNHHVEELSDLSLQMCKHQNCCLIQYLYN